MQTLLCLPAVICLSVVAPGLADGGGERESHPLSAKLRRELTRKFSTTVAAQTKNIAVDPKNVAYYSR
ncbi:MAG: hypothetical protein ACE5KM_06935, partial [Planctomycetaceae bacterium]